VRSACGSYGVIAVGHRMSLHRTVATEVVVETLRKMLEKTTGNEVRLIYSASCRYDLPSGRKHFLADWKNIFADHWREHKCQPPKDSGTKNNRTVSIIAEPVTEGNSKGCV